MQQKQIQKQVQSLALSQEMRQSLHILQMQAVELGEYLNDAITDNPFIEVETSEDPVQSEYRYERFALSEDKADSFEMKLSLKDMLGQQIEVAKLSQKHKAMAYLITDCLDENGYLKEIPDFGSSTAELKEVLTELQKFEPTGIYASSLEECLALQLKERGVFSPQYKLLLESLKLLAMGELAKLRKVVGVSEEVLMDMIKVIKSLEPKPARNFSEDFARIRVPEAIIYKKSSLYDVVLNFNQVPILSFNADNAVVRKDLVRNDDDRKFINTKLREAKILKKACDMRSQMILRLSKVIAEEQYEFFESGINYLKPMTLSDAAGKIGCHESTISRLNNKAIQTPRGVLEFKFFFSSGLNSTFTENAVSATSVKSRIKDLIKAESDKIYSDDDLAEILNKEGVDISRRTVAKYRETLRIPPSNLRKRAKKLYQSPL